jgi:hypothetical protein
MQSIPPELLAFVEAFYRYMTSLGFEPIGKHPVAGFVWRDDDALPILAALRNGSKAVPTTNSLQ